MNKLCFAAKFIVFVLLLTGNGVALPNYGVTKLVSPGKEYSLKLINAKISGLYELRLFRNNIEIGRYPFEEELLSAYWSPSLKFVAINNHNGHGGYYVWIISLADGSVVTAHGIIRDPNYDRYSDVNYFPYIPKVADAELRKIYPGVDSDQLREGYTSVAYGWRDDRQVLMFHELPFENFHPSQNIIIQAFTLWDVNKEGIHFKCAQVRKARDDKDEPMPPEVKKTLNYIP